MFINFLMGLAAPFVAVQGAFQKVIEPARFAGWFLTFNSRKNGKNRVSNPFIIGVSIHERMDEHTGTRRVFESVVEVHL